ncbi:MAG TPA: prolipoprotein diacylglyceryl transferase [Acidimicrobiia bacterium]|nr:prolipoprotein diacylglyceryl transferase [Acidimicrobiia bacterium]
MFPTALAFIPSPSNGVFNLGPLPLHLYGLTLAVGVVAATYIAEARWKRMGHDPKEISSIAVWIVVAGVIGARVYHVITDYQLYTDDPLKAFEIWNGGLAIWGAVAGGAIAAIILARRHHLDTLALFDAIAPGVVLAQGIGRWGNYFNQELFGRPTTLPWAVKIDVAHRPEQYQAYATFHPTFLYESLWCFLLFAVLLWADRIPSHRRGQTFALYIALYTAGRFVFENMRTDPAHVIAGLRINAWVSIVVFLAACAWFVWLGRRPKPAPRPGAEPGGEPGEDLDAAARPGATADAQPSASADPSRE